MPAAVILAAGEGRRLGTTKGLFEIAGRPMVETAVANCAQAMVEEIVLVVGADAAAVEAAARAALEGGDDEPPLRVVHNERWREGRTGSLQAGWQAAGEGTNILLYPVDHPVVRLVTLDVLLGAFGYTAASPQVVVPVHVLDGVRHRGHPVVLGAPLRGDVLALGPDDPLNAFLREATVLEVPVDDEGILVNVNTADDAARAEALASQR